MATYEDLIPYKSYPFHGRLVLASIFFCIPFLMGITNFDASNTADFSCNPDKNVGADLVQKAFIQTSCLNKYQEKYNWSIPLHWSVFLSFGLVLFFSTIYACVVKSRVERFETSVAATNDIERQPLQKHDFRLKKKNCIPVFYLYIAQLLACIISTSLLAVVCFHAHFPTKFSCPWSQPNSTIVTVECENRLGVKKENAAMTAGIVSAGFALIALIEAFYLGRERYCNKPFSRDREFCSSYLLGFGKSKQINIIINSYRNQLSEDENQFKIDIQYNSKGTLDKMYIPLVIQEGQRNDMYGADKKRHEICDAYLKLPREFTLVHDIKHLLKYSKERPQKILVIGRPGIGKSTLSKKILFTSTRAKKGNFYDEKIVILLKFRSFNVPSNKRTLKEMLRHGLRVLDDDDFDCLFKYMLENSEKVLLIFDGLDELKVEDNCVEVAQDASNSHSESMSVFSIWYKLIVKAFLPGATVITTSRPTAHHLYSKLPFKKPLEILGFTEPQIKEYVENFSTNREVKSEKIWSYIEASSELLSLCYVPANSYIVCFTLERCESEASIPKTLTELYKIAMRVLLWDHHRACKSFTMRAEYLNSNSHLPPVVIDELEKLKALAENGMEKDQLIFNLEEVSDMENCGLFNSLTDDYKSQFCFLHLTLQEFLTAWTLVDDCNCRSDVDKVLDKYLQKPRWHLVIQFFAGLLGDKVREGKLSKDCYQCFSKRIPADVSDWKATITREVLLMIKCLYELREPEIVASTAAEIKCEDDLYFLTTHPCGIAPADCTALSWFLMHIKNLHLLDLGGHDLGDSGCRELVKVFENKCNELTDLCLCETKISDEGVQELCRALGNENCKLTRLVLFNNEITDKGVKDLCCALVDENCKLTSIDLSINEITDKGVKDLCCALVDENCKLTSIDLSDIKMKTYEGVQDLCFALENKNCKLTRIDLGHNELTDEDVQDLCRALTNENCKLTAIYLRDILITDEGVQDLCGALKNENCKLTSIDLSDNGITDKGRGDLFAALKNRNCKLKT